MVIVLSMDNSAEGHGLVVAMSIPAGLCLAPMMREANKAAALAAFAFWN